MTAVTLTWGAVSGAESYELWRWRDGAWTRFCSDGPSAQPCSDAKRITATSYSDRGLAPGTKYWYIILSAFAERKSLWSAWASATTFAPTPTAPA